MSKTVSAAEIKTAEALMIKARSKLLMTQPFFGALALKLQLVPITDETVCNTAAVDGRRMFYYPPFINGLVSGGSNAKVVGLVAHEVMHCVFNHMTRRNFRDMEDWNIACDYAINSHLIDNGFVLPDEGIFDTEKKYVGWHAEAIYNDINKKKPENKPKPAPWGMVLDATDPAAQNVEWEVAVRAAAMTAKAAGKLPGNIASMIDEVLTPKVDWRSALWQFATRLDRAEYSWSRPHRAYISEDEYLPSMRSEVLGPLVFIFDTSGSHSDQALKQCWSEVVDVAKHQRPSNLYVVQCDYNVQKAEEIDIDTAGNEKFEIKGRGGTRFGPAFDHVREHYPEAEAVIFLTDMECGFGDCKEPECPVLWISTEKKWSEPPFGDVIYMALDDDK